MQTWAGNLGEIELSKERFDANSETFIPRILNLCIRVGVYVLKRNAVPLRFTVFMRFSDLKKAKKKQQNSLRTFERHDSFRKLRFAFCSNFYAYQGDGKLSSFSAILNVREVLMVK